MKKHQEEDVMPWEAAVKKQLDIFVAEVNTDVERHLLYPDATDLTDLVWTFSIRSDGGLIDIGINGEGTLVKQVYLAEGMALDADMKRLANRVAFMAMQRVLPIIMRLTPRPPFISGDVPSTGRKP